MASFDKALHNTLKWEGGYQNLPGDKGNYNSLNELVGTNYGISAKLYEEVLKRPPSQRDMKELTQATAKDIYRLRFWNRMLGDLWQNDSVASLVFDWYVNSGTWALYHTRKTANDVSGQALFAVSHSNFTPEQVARINALNQETFFKAMVQSRLRFIQNIISKNPSLSQFKNGWERRINSFFF